MELSADAKSVDARRRALPDGQPARHPLSWLDPPPLSADSVFVSLRTLGLAPAGKTEPPSWEVRLPLDDLELDGPPAVRWAPLQPHGQSVLRVECALFTKTT